MKADQLLQLALFYRDNKDFIANEETAKMSLVVPFIRLLGYDPNSPREVRVEYAAEFTQGDGKRLPDRMDFAVFDRSGSKPLMVIETKALGTDLRSKCQQLARYISQLPELHFGIMTDGCNYLFFGDLESPNVMDREPFFSFSLDDETADWDNVAALLSKFSRETFNAAELLTDAEDSRYRRAISDRLVGALRSPAADAAFMKWLTDGVYKGKRTEAVMLRLGSIAAEAVEPALLRVMGDEIIERLKQRLRAAQEPEAEGRGLSAGAGVAAADSDQEKAQRGEITEDELRFYELVKGVVVQMGYKAEQVLFRDTIYYSNVSYGRPTRWFVRFFGNSKRQHMTTLLPVERVAELAPGFEVEAAPAGFGASRVYVDSVEQIEQLAPVIVASLRTLLRE